MYLMVQFSFVCYELIVLKISLSFSWVSGVHIRLDCSYFDICLNSLQHGQLPKVNTLLINLCTFSAISFILLDIEWGVADNIRHQILSLFGRFHLCNHIPR